MSFIGKLGLNNAKINNYRVWKIGAVSFVNNDKFMLQSIRVSSEVDDT
jgi:hypothetical protein